MDISRETEMLINSRLLRTEQEIQQFEQAIVNIRSMNEVSHLRNLCLGFDDATEQEEIMFGLVHAIESYDENFGSEKPLIELANALPAMLPKAKGWAKTLHKRILNHEPSRHVYAEVISNLDPHVKNMAAQLVREIMDKNPQKFGVSASEFLSNVK